MNRRGFIALATAATVAPQELIAAPVAPAVDLDAIAAERFRALTQSMLQTREMTMAKFIAPSALLQELQKMLNEEFSGLYECIPYEDLFEDEETLASEERGCDSALLPGREETERAAEDPAVECRGAGSVHNPVGVGESSRSDLRQRG